MMQIMNVITDKPEWDHKVFDEQVTSTWRQEAARSGEDVTPKMMDWIIKELQWKAGILQKTGYVQVFDDGVLKSDTAISKELQIAVKDAVAALEDVPEEEKDYHPDSDDKVVDLVHPSLFPVIYGRTRVVPDRVIGLEHCLDSFGQGQTLPQPSDKEAVPQGSSGLTADPSVAPELSTKFQWLPCDFEYAENGRCHILSYINNAHPIKHRALYEVVERILAHTMPLWQKSLTDKPPQSERIVFKDVEYEEDTVPCPQPTDPSVDVPRLMDERAYYRLVDAWWDSRRIVRPEPGQFTVRKSLHDDLDFRKHFPDTKFQVIVKLANIELKPGKPNYEGGTWHMEGQLVSELWSRLICFDRFVLTILAYAPSRMSASSRRPFTTTTTRILRLAHWHSAIVEWRTCFESITRKIDTSFSSKYMASLPITMITQAG